MCPRERRDGSAASKAVGTTLSDGYRGMSSSVAIIGSFKTRERYAEVLAAITAFRSQGWTINSPAGSRVLQADVDFVRFETDRPDMSDAEVQSRTMERILAADITYVSAPGGYIGRTTCYEIGRLIQATRAVFFSEFPKDLPILIPSMFIAEAGTVARTYKGKRVPTLCEAGDDVVSLIERRLAPYA